MAHWHEFGGAAHNVPMPHKYGPKCCASKRRRRCRMDQARRWRSRQRPSRSPCRQSHRRVRKQDYLLQAFIETYSHIARVLSTALCVNADASDLRLAATRWKECRRGASARNGGADGRTAPTRRRAHEGEPVTASSSIGIGNAVDPIGGNFAGQAAVSRSGE